ncbi:MAG TPA: ABC transporter ATP-binding protein [Sumerlaeia bacterium]|nr:ABC transporter ATP-binding protein [Sumerlaeia bacterium]
MSNSVMIRVEGLGKRYRLGQTLDLRRTFRETLMTLPRFLGQKTARAARELAARARRGDAAAGEGGGPDTPAGTFWALRDIAFDVRQGEVLGIIGRNGAGKSTLLRVLSRITAPTRGHAEIYGRLGTLLEVGTGFHPELTGRENVYMNGAILGMRKAEIDARFDEIVAFAEVDRFLDTPVKRFSSGMYVRLAFSVAAHLEPEILVVDEVLAVGDAGFQKKCLGKMQDVAGGGRTVLFVSHNMAAIQRLCTRALLLEEGRLVCQGPPHQVVDTYLQGGLQRVGERRWDTPEGAPGNDVARLRAVRAVDARGNVANEFSVREPFSVEVEFWVLKAGHTLNSGFYFYDASGDLLLVTGSFQDETWQERPRPVGVHRDRCHIPPDLLNEGALNVMAYVRSDPRPLHAQERDALQIRIRDDFDPGGARGSYSREWPGGAVRPLLKWTFDYKTTA